VEYDTAGYLEINIWETPALYFGYQSTLPIPEAEKENIEPKNRIGFI
jgi:hypothetical protein